MKKIDIRLNHDEIALLKSFIGTEFKSISHESFIFTNSVSGTVQFNINNKIFYLYSDIEPLEHFGSIEDTAIWSLETQKYVGVNVENFVTTPIKEIIRKIILVQENQRIYENEEQTYDVWVTRGIIFDFGNHQISFEKAIWFSEEIYIQKGYNLIEKFTPTENFLEDWDNGIVPECTRELVVIE